MRYLGFNLVQVNNFRNMLPYICKRYDWLADERGPPPTFLIPLPALVSWVPDEMGLHDERWQRSGRSFINTVDYPCRRSLDTMTDTLAATEWHRDKPFAASGADSDSNDYASVEKARTTDAITKTATGQAQIGADEEFEGIDKRTFLACLALSFLWTGSQVPLYMLLVCIDYTIADIGGADVQIWFVLGPLTALAATAPIAGSISDIFGRRWAILVGGIFTIIGLILIGSTKTVAQEIVSFPFTGIGAALLEINALAGVNEIAPNRLRGFYTSMLIWTIIPFAPLGIYALELSDNATWRWNAWIPLIWTGIGQVMTFIFYKPPPRIFQGHEFTKMEKMRRVDWIGFFLSLAGSVLFLFGLGAGGYTAPWKSALTLVPLILGFLLLVALGFWQLHARHPVYPPGMFKNTRVFVLTLVITAIAGANFFSILILWPKFVISVFQPTPVYGGLLILGQTMGVLFGAGFFSFLITQFRGSIRPQMFLACGMMMAGFGALYVTNKDRGALAAVLVTIGSIGVGGIIIPASVITQLCTPDEYLGTVTAITFVARVLGGAIGFTVYYYVLNKRATFLFNDFLHFKPALNVVTILLSQGFNVAQITTFLQRLAISDVKFLYAFSPKVTPALIRFTSFAARDVWSTAFQQVWLCTLGFSGVAAICSIFLGDVRKYSTNHRAVHF
ncbi:hypothetical protein PYCC9005_004588 [Savitreella phatthalungensis]